MQQLKHQHSANYINDVNGNNQFTVSSTITPLKPLCSQVIGVSEPTRPDIETTNGNTLDAVSNSCAVGKQNGKEHLQSVYVT